MVLRFREENNLPHKAILVLDVFLDTYKICWKRTPLDV